MDGGRDNPVDDGDFWVFAYGSLIWNPGFAFTSREPAILAGYHRRYCIRSMIYRGTPEAPGLVLGLEAGGHCEGIGYRIAGALKRATMQYLRERELVTSVYDETLVGIQTRDGGAYRAYTYVAKPGHEQYVRLDDLDELVATIEKASGIAGANYEYAINTWEKLADFGIGDPEVERVANALRCRTARG